MTIKPNHYFGEETIVAAACRSPGDVRIFALPAPARHRQVMDHMERSGRSPNVRPDDQGFLTSRGRFVGRFEARDIARLNGQVPKPSHPDELFSEDLW